jgi:anti-sigma factor RsiW
MRDEDLDLRILCGPGDPLPRCAACAAGAERDEGTMGLVRAAFDDADSTPIPEELVAEILRGRREASMSLINVLTGLVASPLLAFSVGI